MEGLYLDDLLETDTILMKRTPSSRVRRELRQEVGFGCPIPAEGHSCGNPYLSWHHFDPPWNIRQHHNSNGMIALCAEHHNKADAHTWTKEQLRAFKRSARQSGRQVKGRFDWMHQRLLGIMGSSLLYDCHVLFSYRKQPIIWFERDKDDYLLVNLRMPRTPYVAELVVERNDWVMSTDMLDVECPPSGRLLRVTYPNGDTLRLEFRSVESSQELVKRFPDHTRLLTVLEYPLASVEFAVRVPALDINIDSKRGMQLPHSLTIQGVSMYGVRDAFNIE